MPVLLGSSYKNMGVQPLLNAVINYLPSATDRLPTAVQLYAPHFCALAFKIVYDRQRGGLLTFVRIYTGTLQQVGEAQCHCKAILISLSGRLGCIFIHFVSYYYVDILFYWRSVFFFKLPLSVLHC